MNLGVHTLWTRSQEPLKTIGNTETSSKKEDPLKAYLSSIECAVIGTQPFSLVKKELSSIDVSELWMEKDVTVSYKSV